VAAFISSLEAVSSVKGMFWHEGQTFMGRRSQKRDPARRWLSTPIWPPMSSTRRLQMASPSPVPPKRRVLELSTCVKAWKSCCLLLRRHADACVGDAHLDVHQA
jgi:hypothetical protein